MLDPKQEIVSTSGLSEDEVGQVVRVLDAIREWREAEQRLSLESRNDMQLGENDMKALRFLVLCKNQNIVATPGALAEHLAVSSAATTKLLDRLEAAGHIQRSPHPTDRRAITITITQSTHEQVRHRRQDPRAPLRGRGAVDAGRARARDPIPQGSQRALIRRRPDSH